MKVGQRDLRHFLSTPSRSVHAENLLFRTPGNAICLNLGYPPPEVFPTGELFDAVQTLYDNKLEQIAFQYCEEHGDRELRETLKDFYSRSAMPVDADNIVITHGTTTDSLPCLSQLLLDPGDLVLLGAPSYLWAIRVFRQFRAKLVAIETDDEGIEPTALRSSLKKLLAKGAKAKFIYVMADFHNPLGASMSIVRRQAILDIAYEYDVLILEDNAYSHLRDSYVPSIFDLDKRTMVVQMRTFSKMLGPGIRLSWIAGPEYLMRRLALIRSGGACTYTSRIVANVLKSGTLDSIITGARNMYASRMKTLLLSLDNCMGNLAQWNRPEGGFYVWLRFPKGIDENLLCEKAAGAGVLVLGGSFFYSEPTEQATLRLSCSFEPPHRIEYGIERLTTAVQSMSGC